MKKQAAVFLSLIMVLLLAAGCSQNHASNSGSAAGSKSAGSSTGSGSGKQTPAKKVTLKVWGDSANQAVLEGPFKKINEAFMKKYPNIKLDYQYSETENSLNVALQANSLPDAFYVQGNKSTKMAEMVKNKQIIPLDSSNFDLKRFPKGAVDYAEVNGKLYCSPPQFFDYAMVYYNKAIFAKYNLKAPKTWDDLVNIVKTLKQHNVTPIAVGGNGDFDRYWPVQVFAPVFAEGDLEKIDKGQKTGLDDSQLTDLFNTYASFVKNGYFGKNVEAINGKSAQLAFTNGKAAMIVDGTWDNKLYAQTSLKIGRFAIPDKNGVKWAQEGMNNSTTYAVSATSKHPKEAAEYVQFLASQQAGQIMEDANGNVPVVKDIKPKDKVVKQFAAYNKVGKNIYITLSHAASKTSKPQNLLLSDILPKLMTQKITGAQATQLLKQELNK